jgi:hypothetical protein
MGSEPADEPGGASAAPAGVGKEEARESEAALWPDRVLAVAGSFYEWLSRPRVRLTVTGVILLVIGGVFMTSSVWTLPLVLVGALMVAIAWIGRRLEGRFAVEWGETGTQLEFRAKIMAPQPLRPPAARTSSSADQRMLRPEFGSVNAEIIDGEAHTIEIDVAELEALIAAAETTSGQLEETHASVRAVRDLRADQGGARSSEAER